LKTPKTNFVQLNKLYIFALRLNPKMCFDFEMGFPGQNLKAEIRVFENPNPNKTWNMIQTLQGNTYNTNINLF